MTPLAPVSNEHDPDWHRAKLAEFTELKRRIGEPSPHMTAVNEMWRGMPLEERLWAIGCYAVPYSLLSATALWSAFPWLSGCDRDALGAFIADKWAGIHTRTERRAVRAPAKFTRSLTSYLAWVESGEPERMLRRSADYEEWWESVNRIDFFGRYIAIRVIEAVRRSEDLHGRPHPEMELRDIRSVGGHSPIRALTLFFPEATDALLAQDAQTADVLAEGLLYELKDTGLQVDHYVFAAMLCEYREAYEDHHQYPGRTVDQELEYLRGPKAEFWGEDLFAPIWDVRKKIHPAAALGELNGWGGVRDELSRWLRDRGENWSDLLHQYAEA